MKNYTAFLVAMCACLGWNQAFGAITTIDFDDLASETIVTNQYSGVSFTGAEILTAGVSLNPEFPPVSGSNVVYDYSNGIITAAPTAGTWDFVGGYITGNTSITLFAYDASNDLLGEVSTGGANYVGSGTGLNPNIFLSLSKPDIAYVSFHDTGNTFTLDNFEYEASSSVVPEPTTLVVWSLLGALAVGLGCWRQRKAA
ncbi:MAG: hypothetical protein ACLP9L_27795 [Thermoguttaceae bacterium]